MWRVFPRRWDSWIMTDHRQRLDPVEETMLELDAGERAGLFGRTQIDGRLLLLQPVRLGSRRLVFRLLPAAAAAVIAIGVWTWMFRVELAGLRRDNGVSAGTVAGVPAKDYRSFYACHNGPTEGLVSGCLGQDYDADGDVDLADFGAYQLAYADTTP